MLHLIFSFAGLQRAQKHICNEDAIVFLEDGCYVAQTIDDIPTHILDSHAETRAIEIPPELDPCNMSDLVHLMTEHEKSISWK